jgi:beta-lactamase regulating signal transducer with metallopeptidase domain
LAGGAAQSATAGATQDSARRAALLSHSAALPDGPDAAGAEPSRIASSSSAPILDARRWWLPLAAGTILFLSLAATRAFRFQRSLRGATVAPAELRARAAELARRLGLNRVPAIRVVPGRISPSLWPGSGRCEVLLPVELLARLAPEELDTVIAHELAHIRRRDHWLRPLELLIVALYWWHPVAWWARRNLRVAEEKACDALVIQAMPHQARAYAEGLLKTVELLSASRTRASALATGAAQSSRLEERMTMILRDQPPASLPARLRTPLLAAAMLAILVSPAWLEIASTHAEDADPDQLHQLQLLQIQRDELELRRQLIDLEAKRMAIQLQIEKAQLQLHVTLVREEIEQLREQGKAEEAALMQLQLAEMERKAVLHRQQIEFERAHQRRHAELELQLQEVVMQREELVAQGEEARARKLDPQLRAIELELQRLQLQALAAELEHGRRQLQLETRDLDEVLPDH